MDKAKNKWPKYRPDALERELPSCRIDYNDCFTDGEGQPYTHASDVFKNIAFRKLQCGDCGAWLVAPYFAILFTHIAHVL